MADHIQKLNSAHHAIALFEVTNPGATDAEIGRALGYTGPWISRVRHSDMYQAYYKGLCDRRDLPEIQTIQDKLAHAGHQLLDRLNEKLTLPSVVLSEKFLLGAGEMVLDRLGFSGKGDLHLHEHREQHLHLTAEHINAARERARKTHSGELLDATT